MARCPQASHRSRCPPRAAVRQRAIARRTDRCCALSHGCCSRKVSPCAWRISATSTAGRLTLRLASASAGTAEDHGRRHVQLLKGLGAAWRCRRDRWRYTVVCDRSAWPSSSCIVRRSAPASSRWVAYECRSVCGVTRLSIPGLPCGQAHGVPDHLRRDGRIGPPAVARPRKEIGLRSHPAVVLDGAPRAAWDSGESRDRGRPCPARPGAPCAGYRCRGL